MKRIFELVGRTVPLGLLLAHCATETDSGSQTHWLATCSRDTDCGAGLVCLCGRCMKECTDGACSNLGRPAECVTSTSTAHESLCGAGPAVAPVCLPTCASGCNSSEHCVAGYCLPAEGRPEAGPGPADGGPCPGDQVLVYETPGCGPTVKPVCDGPTFDACAMQACGCDGVTFSGGCGVFDKPFLHTGPCNDGGRESGTGRDGGTWVGAPCEECNLPSQFARLVDGAPEDCGIVPLDAGGASAADCAHVAFLAGRPFSVIVEEVGTDSMLGVGWFFASGQLYVVSYDSNVCGSSLPTCDTVGCGPSVGRSRCVNPTVSTEPRKFFDCSNLVDAQTICGPNPNCHEGRCF